MNADTLVNIIGVIVLPAAGYLLMRMGSLQRELSEYKTHVAEQYTKKSDMTAALDKVETNFQRVFEKLDLLAERRSHARGEGDAT